MICAFHIITLPSSFLPSVKLAFISLQPLRIKQCWQFRVLPGSRSQSITPLAAPLRAANPFRTSAFPQQKAVLLRSGSKKLSLSSPFVDHIAKRCSWDWLPWTVVHADHSDRAQLKSNVSIFTSPQGPLV